MARITVEDCLRKVESRFALVILGAKRAKMLMRGWSSYGFADPLQVLNADIDPASLLSPC